MEIKLGDWISWWDGTRLVIDEVKYLVKDDWYPYSTRAYCRYGTISIKNVLEVRKSNE
jgi:hypothetical protein